jgi:murein DD-endopeptidase MepM/ murein hydrolase activator NlpD
MRNKITIFWLTNKSDSLKQISLSKAGFSLLLFFFILCITSLGFVTYSYNNIKKKGIYASSLKSNIVEQQSDIVALNKQIQVLGAKINSIKARLVALNDFEKSIRVIANIENSDKENDSFMFGTGGVVPADLNTDTPIEESHNSLIRDMHEQLDQIDLVSIKQQADFEELVKVLEAKRNLLASTPAIKPLRGYITSKFGYRVSPFTGKREFHNGYDIAAQEGTPIIAPADGIVAFSGNKGLLGDAIILNHGHGITTKYGHLSKLMKNQGESVKRGDIIALVGNTGRSTGPHLHYEVCLNGIPVNPEKYMLD